MYVLTFLHVVVCAHVVKLMGVRVARSGQGETQQDPVASELEAHIERGALLIVRVRVVIRLDGCCPDGLVVIHIGCGGG